jgi:peptidoglycan/xylan/chitin deacetylase (PgdA/CDA1 family)
MRHFRPGFLAVRLFPEALFRGKTTEKVLYLTFDDGPDVISTIPLLKILSKNKVRAVFFCSGKAASENPDLIIRIKSAGHIIGNHGYCHLNGLLTSKRRYLMDIEKAAEFTSDSLFRPPYGKIKINQYRTIKRSYKIIMWDIMLYDFDRTFGGERSLSILKKKICPGAIVVLHDSPQSTVLEFLDTFIEFAYREGYRFDIPV